MSRLLLDTHALLWFVFDDPRLSETADAAIADPHAVKALSVASLWEIAIKVSLGKLELGMSFERFVADEIDRSELVVLPISHSHLTRVVALPYHHRDPFDRLLVAQAAAEELTIVTADPRFAAYGVSVVW